MNRGLLFLYAVVLLAVHPGRVGADSHCDAAGFRRRYLRRLTDTNNPDGPCTCFSADASVHVRGKGAVSMRDLEVGDQVLSGKTNQYQRIYAFLHRSETSEADFLQLETDLPSTKPLELTADHLLYLRGKKSPIRAGSIVVGDVLQGEGDKAARVTRITHTYRYDGIYGPATPDGTIVVDGIKASSYVALKDLKDHPLFGLDVVFIQHTALSPFRFACQWVSPKYALSFNEEGIPLMASLLYDFGSWIVRQSVAIQVVSILCYGVFAAFFWILECLLDSIWVSAIVAVMAFVILYKKKELGTAERTGNSRCAHPHTHQTQKSVSQPSRSTGKERRKQ